MRSRWFILLLTLTLGSSIARGEVVLPGVYALHNHPAGNAAPPEYGLRLVELFDVTDEFDVFTFDFDAPGAGMHMEYDGNSIHIWGTAYGGLDTGDGYGNATYTSYVTIDFTYDVGVMSAPRDDDIVVHARNFANTGTIVWHDAGATGDPVTFDLADYRGWRPFSFRLGDGRDENGHLGVPGISGWGRLGEPDARCHTSSTWLFRAQLVPLPPTVLLGAAGLGLVAMYRRRRQRASA